eukprot:170935-Prymnesium_polylepis.1
MRRTSASGGGAAPPAAAWLAWHAAAISARNCACSSALASGRASAGASTATWPQTHAPPVG